MLQMHLIFSALNQIFQMMNEEKLDILYSSKCDKWFTQTFH